MRFEVLRRDAEIAFLHNCMESDAGSQRGVTLETGYRKTCQRFSDDIAFLRKADIGGEFMSEDEVIKLSIRRRTLYDREREAINYHIVATIKMLESLWFSEVFEECARVCGWPSRKMDGNGYPRGLKREEMSVQARIMAVADIFEALTARDRPYKKGKKLSECLNIMGPMKIGSHIDPDIFDIFIRQRVYQDYAVEFLDPEQIDEIDEAVIPGYAG